MFKHFLILLLLATLSSVEAKTFQVMSYNVENLFDTKHDEGKNDWTFLPKDTPKKDEECNHIKVKHYKKECKEGDWTEKKLEMKLSQIKDVVTKERSLPDFLGVVEVENSNVVGMLAKKLGYENFEITDSPDERGIDVALFYKTDSSIKKVSRAEHVVSGDNPTRNILEVEFLLEGKYPLTVFVNHWPSLAGPDASRIKAAEVLAKRAKEIQTKNPQMAILAMGDFNSEDSNPIAFTSVLFKDNLFQDVSYSESVVKNASIKKQEGTYYYPPKDKWDHLDRFFANKSLIEGKEFKLLADSYEIYAPAFMLFPYEKKKGSSGDVKIVQKPKRFEADATTAETMGYSDHFPILLKLEVPDAPKAEKKSAGKKKK